MGEVRVQFLGSGDAFGSGGRLQTCILLRTPQTAALIDCGASALIAMKRFGVSPADVATILLTHLHGDHFGGLPFFILDAQFSRRTDPLVVVGPLGVEVRVRDAMEVLFPGSSHTAQRFPVQFVELGTSATTTVNGVTVTTYPVEHASGAPAYALRLVCEGKVVAYSGDTAWTEALVPAASAADLFICEAYTWDKPVKYHLDYRTLRQHQAQLDCRRLVLTHMSADMLAHRTESAYECADDGLVLVV